MTGTPITTDIAGNVRAEVARRRIRQADLATATGLDQRAVSRRLLGQVRWTADELAAVAPLLQVSVGQLLGEVPA